MKFFKIIFILNFLVSLNVISNEHSFEIIDYENRFNPFFCNIKDSLDVTESGIMLINNEYLHDKRVYSVTVE